MKLPIIVNSFTHWIDPEEFGQMPLWLAIPLCLLILAGVALFIGTVLWGVV